MALPHLRVEDIMDYFGEVGIDEAQAEGLRRRVTGKFGDSYFGEMDEVRRILREYGLDVPFRSQYRRAK